MKKLFITIAIIISIVNSSKSQVVPQGFLINPNTETVTIGTQIWMKRNLDVVAFQNGDLIDRADLSFNNNITLPAWCYYNHNAAFNPIYGKLYNGYAIKDPRNVCPIGFRVPTNADFNTLATYVGGVDYCFRLREVGTSHWTAPNTGANDLYGFTALPGGYMGDQNSSSNMFGFGYFWTSTPIPGGSTNYVRYLASSYGTLRESNVFVLEGGVSVRCIKN